MQVKVKKLHPEAHIPTYATDGSGCFDLYYHRGSMDSPGAGFAYTGLSFEIPEGYVMLVFSRSGHGFKHDVRLSNCVGVIDSDYRGEVVIKMRADFNHGINSLTINRGDRFAQALIIPIPRIEFEEVETLSKTIRGTNGFGSTGN